MIWLLIFLVSFFTLFFNMLWINDKEVVQGD